MSAWGCSWGASWGRSFGPIDAWGGSWGDSWNGSWRIICPSTATKAPTYLIPRPEGYTFNDWASAVTEAFSSLGIASPTAEENWQEWVCSMFYDPSLCAMNIPSPQGFPDWQQWAAQFVEAVH